MLFVVLLCSVVGVWGGVIFFLSVMHVVSGVLSRVVCVFRHSYVVCFCLLCILLQF